MAATYGDLAGLDSDEDDDVPGVQPVAGEHKNKKASSNVDDDHHQPTPNPLHAFARGFGTVLTGRTVLSLIIGLMKRRSLRKTVGVIAAPEVLRQAAFFGSFAGIYAAVVNRAKIALPNLTPGFAEAIAGAIAGLSIMVDDPHRRNSLALYMLSRSSALFCATGVRTGRLRDIPHFPAWVFALCEIPIMTGFLFYQQYLDPSYMNLIVKWSRDQKAEFLSRFIRIANPTEIFLSCEDVGFHAGPCVPYLADDFLQNWWITAKMYIPLYCIPRATLSLDRTLKSPVETVKATAKDIFYSGMMLATYIFMMKSSLCSYRHLTQHKQGDASLWLGVIGGFLTGSGILWETSSRQKELAIYVLPQAAIVVWNALVDKGRVKHMRGANTIMFSVAMAGIMYHIKQHRNDVKPFVRSPLERIIFGPSKNSSRKKEK